jgi:uncharacterized protein
LTKIATKYKYVVLEASNKSDLKDFRPGIVATKEMGVKSPFIESDIKKEEIRVFAKRFGLPNWARPSNACLATRIPYGKKIDKKTLKRIDYAETYLRRLNLTQLRVREHFPIARIEIRTSEFKKILIHRLRIIKYFKRLGYRYITIDLSGYKSGSMNILE